MLRCTCQDQHCRDPGNQVGLRSNLDFSDTTSSLAWAGGLLLTYKFKLIKNEITLWKTKIDNIQSCMKYSISFEAPCYSSIQWRGMYGVDWRKEAYWWSGGLSKVAWGNGSELCSDACSLTQRLHPHDQIGVVSVKARPDSFFPREDICQSFLHFCIFILDFRVL